MKSYLATLYGALNAKKTLLAGFTTVRNVGGKLCRCCTQTAIKEG
ncbi:MAG: hypothetical protein CM15mP22_5990 [Gammaproteobacteria bacterium]|nr:MAG: hypothetical protein CM15mP22_5990 [Gammaproteobacteria bacterium]